MFLFNVATFSSNDLLNAAPEGLAGTDDARAVNGIPVPVDGGLEGPHTLVAVGPHLPLHLSLHVVVQDIQVR